jgi:hypothetical protein
VCACARPDGAQPRRACGGEQARSWQRRARAGAAGRAGPTRLLASKGLAQVFGKIVHAVRLAERQLVVVKLREQGGGGRDQLLEHSASGNRGPRQRDAAATVRGVSVETRVWTCQGQGSRGQYARCEGGSQRSTASAASLLRDCHLHVDRFAILEGARCHTWQVKRLRSSPPASLVTLGMQLLDAPMSDARGTLDLQQAKRRGTTGML